MIIGECERKKKKKKEENKPKFIRKLKRKSWTILTHPILQVG